YFTYHAVPTNNQALAAFRFFVTEFWQRSLRRRSQKDGTTWHQIAQLAKDWLPKPDTLHPWPRIRFAVTHPRWEPYAGKPHVRFCAGGAMKIASLPLHRRAVILGLGSATAAAALRSPRVELAQQDAMPVIGILHSTPLTARAPYVGAFLMG